MRKFRATFGQLKANFPKILGYMAQSIRINESHLIAVKDILIFDFKKEPKRDLRELVLNNPNNGLREPYQLLYVATPPRYGALHLISLFSLFNDLCPDEFVSCLFHFRFVFVVLSEYKGTKIF